MKFCLVVFFATKLVFHCKVCSQKQLLVIAVTLIFKIAAKKLRSDKKELHWPPFLIVAIDLVLFVSENGKNFSRKVHASSEYLFSISKFGLITSKKLNICKADKMKHSPNITNQNLDFSKK